MVATSPPDLPTPGSSTRDRVSALLKRMANEPQYPTQGTVVFVDLVTKEIRSAYMPLQVVRTFLAGRGGNMFLLANLLDTALPPEDPDIPLIYGTGLLTATVPAAARGNITSRSPESKIILDSNAGDYFPSFLRLRGIQHLVLYGRSPDPIYIMINDGGLAIQPAADLMGMDNIELRQRIAKDTSGQWGRDLAMVNTTRAAENGARTAGLMAGDKAIHGRGGGGFKLASLNVKAIIIHGKSQGRLQYADPPAVPGINKEIARKIKGTGVFGVLSTMGTQFLYRPSRLLHALGVKNNQETGWVEDLDHENFDRFRPGMAGCYRCPVRCRPLGDISSMLPDDPDILALMAVAEEFGKPPHSYLIGDGPEYVTMGKFGPNLGITQPQVVIYLNNICNDLGFDTSGTGGALAWAFELFQRGLITEADTGGLKLEWGDAPMVARLLFQTSQGTGFGKTIAAGSRAVELGFYPEEALQYRMTVKGLMQSDPHDARILKGFALGLAVSTRGFDHLRNRVTLEINARINDSPEYKASLYGGPVSGAPNSYGGKEFAVKTCEELYAVGDALGQCRFTTKLFNSPNLPGYPEFRKALKAAVGLEFTEEELAAIGANIRGLERMINHSLGLRKADDTVPRRWLEEPLTTGPHTGEKIDQGEFEALLDRFYELCSLNGEGIPTHELRSVLNEIVFGFNITVRIPEEVYPTTEGFVTVRKPVSTVGELLKDLEDAHPGLTARFLDTEASVNVSINDEMIVHETMAAEVKNGDRLEFVQAFSGG